MASSQHEADLAQAPGAVHGLRRSESQREHRRGWSGFRGSRPRIGNAASTQLQLDVFGEVIDSLYSLALAEHLGSIDRETRKMVVGFGRSVAELWNRPDQGIWEFRSQPRHYTHSKLMCCVAMDRLARLSERYSWRLGYYAAGIAARIRVAIESEAHCPHFHAAGMPLLPSFHPRMASEQHGPRPTRQFEPPGFLARNYGVRTPLATVVAHLIYGTILGFLT